MGHQFNLRKLFRVLIIFPLSRCDIPARAIANALRDICKKILIERSLAQSSSKLMSGGSGGVSSEEKKRNSLSSSQMTSSAKSSSTSSSTGLSSSSSRQSSGGGGGGRLRPTSLGSSGANAKLQTRTVPAPESFPTPMEEPRKVRTDFFRRRN